MDRETLESIFGAATVVVAILLIIGLFMWVIPEYRVWSKELKGKATLREAQWDRQVKVEEAKAALESAHFQKQSDSVRAVGTAIANKIIAKSITPEYIQWMWVQGLHDGSSEVIYVPTEANLPILEATRKLKLNQGE